jgi:hypothetical protein
MPVKVSFADLTHMGQMVAAMRLMTTDDIAEESF